MKYDYANVLCSSNDAISLIGFPGEIFMQIVEMMILPMIISSVISGQLILQSAFFLKFSFQCKRFAGKTQLVSLREFSTSKAYRTFLARVNSALNIRRSDSEYL